MPLYGCKMFLCSSVEQVKSEPKHLKKLCSNMEILKGPLQWTNKHLRWFGMLKYLTGDYLPHLFVFFLNFCIASDQIKVVFYRKTVKIYNF